MPRKIRIEKDTTDHRYFVIVPRLVWAKSRSPYDVELWRVIKDIAGEEGVCMLPTQDLADMAQMSAGKVSDCRKHLLSVGLLQGEVYRDPGYPQPVYHLRIPDIWAENVEWSMKYRTFKDRLAYKRAFLASLHEGSKDGEPSCSERGILSGERGIPLDERGIPLDETKKNGKEEEKEEPKEHTPANDPIIPNKIPETQEPDEEMLFLDPTRAIKNPRALKALEASAEREASGQLDLSAWHEEFRPMAQEFHEVFSLPLPKDKGTIKNWETEFRKFRTNCDGTSTRAVMERIKEMAKSWTGGGVGRPHALHNSTSQALAYIHSPEAKGNGETKVKVGLTVSQMQTSNELDALLKERGQCKQ